MRSCSQFLTYFIFVLGISIPLAADDSIEKEKVVLLERTDALLEKLEAAVLSDLKKTENEIESDAQNVVETSTGDAEREAKIKAEDLQMRQKVVNLNRKIDSWATSGKEILRTVSGKELTDTMAEARAVARYYGLDVEKLGKLYALGKKAIKNAEFVIPEKLPPDEDESLRRYFQSFFVFAEEREKELSEFREKQQEYRLNLFKRVTLAYIRALLAASEGVPTCKKSEAGSTINYDKKQIKTFGCSDPVLEQLRAYIQAVQKIASADAGAYSAQAEMVVAEQVLTADMAAVIPLVGEAIDFYQLYSGENLAGQCLSRFEYSLTAVFSAIPFLPANWATQVVKRMELEESLSRFIMLMAQVGDWSDEMIAGMAARYGITPEMFLAAEKNLEALSILLNTSLIEVSGVPDGGKALEGLARTFGISEGRIQQVSATLRRDVTLGGAEEVAAQSGKISRSAAQELNEKLEREAVERARLVSDDAAEGLLGDIVYQNNLREAFDAEQLLRRLPENIRARMERKSEEILEKNLMRIPANAKAAAGDTTEVLELSNMVPDHVRVYQEVAEELDRPLVFRSVNSKSTEIIAAHYPTKGMNVKGKSADWGPQAAFIPVDQKFSKLGNPGSVPDLDEIRTFYNKVAKCLAAGKCEKAALTLPSGDEVFIWNGPAGEVPIVKRARDGAFVDHDSGKIMSVTQESVRPMEVLAARDASGNLVPLTADYDLLAVGSRAPVSATGKWNDGKGRFEVDPELGYTTPVERDTIEKLADANDRTSYEGGRLVHHGPESQFVHSPGALAQDPYVTVLDPKRGPLIIERCDFACMDSWCRTSGMCGAMSICQEKHPRPPCMMIDPDRLLKDYFGNLRLRGYTDIRPNTAWKWGEYNGLAGWSPKVVLSVPEGAAEDSSKWVFGQYKMTEGVRVVDVPSIISSAKDRSTYDALKVMGIKATQYLFTCPGITPPTTTGGG